MTTSSPKHRRRVSISLLWLVASIPTCAYLWCDALWLHWGPS